MLFVAILLTFLCMASLIKGIQTSEQKGIYIIISTGFIFVMLFILFVGITLHEGQSFEERHQEVVQTVIDSVFQPIGLWIQPFENYIPFANACILLILNSLYLLYTKLKLKKDSDSANSSMKFIKRMYVFGSFAFIFGVLTITDFL